MDFIRKINDNKFRFILIFLLFICLFLYLCINLYKIQIVKGDKYKKEKIQQMSSIPNGDSSRGNIYATRKDGELIALASMRTWYKLALIPKDVPESYENRLYSKITEIVKIDREIYNQKISKKTDPYEEIAELSPEDAAKIEDLRLVGVKAYKYNQRIYPINQVGAKVIGFVGGGENGYSGRAGLEKYYNDTLTKKSESKTLNFIKDLYAQKEDYEAGFSEYKEEENKSQNLDIVTTLEPNVMKYNYEVLNELQKKWGAETVASVIMNIRTGEIVAMDGLPSYDPNKYSEYENKNFINPIVQGVYELGSIFKPLTMAIGIKEAGITPETTFEDRGKVSFDGYTIQNFDKKIRGTVTMQTVLGDSLNTGVVYVMQKLGRDKFREGLAKFDINEETGIDLPGEVSNKTDNLNSKQEIDYATISFGQGIALTPISMLRALSSIANEGKLVTPYVVKSTKYKNGSQDDVSPQKENNISIEANTANITKNMLIKIVDEYLGKGKNKNQQYKIGAKTGTAQLTKEKGGYFEDKFLHSYFTFFGSKDNEYAMLLMQVNPKGSELSSVTLTPYANKIVNFMINYYNIPPDRIAKQ